MTIESLRGKRINRYVFFGGGVARNFLFPRFFKWGHNLSIVWRRLELIITWRKGGIE